MIDLKLNNQAVIQHRGYGQYIGFLIVSESERSIHFPHIGRVYK
ncbi:hypothetical protein ES705_36352 [subsurface metagenome]